MILFIGFIETIFIFLIGVLLGVCLSYELFSIELRKQLNHDKMVELFKRMGDNK